MPTSIDQILPSLQSLGLWSYWIIGLSSMFEAFFVTGIFIPGTLIVEAGGILVQNGMLDFFDLAWFVAIGSFLGGEASFWMGVWGARGLKGRWDPTRWKHFERAERLFQRHGGAGLIIGRFLGPVSGLVPFAAALANMDRRKFVLWNAIASVPYALAQLAFGFFLGDALSQLGPLTTREVLFGLAAIAALAVLWYLVLRIERSLPFVWSVLASMGRAIWENPDVRVWSGRHPRMSSELAARFDSTRFQGLSATLLGATFGYVLLIWVGTAFDFLRSRPNIATDLRLAELVHGFWTPWLLSAFTRITALGDWKVVTLVYLVVAGALLMRNRRALVAGLSVALIGNATSVALLKVLFDRPRPVLAYFVETSGSFPSGHAAVSVAFFGMLAYILWRRRFLGPIGSALVGATAAFLIGLSRVYLIEHYLSDVVNGYLVGLMWLLVGITIAEYYHQSSPAQAAPTGMSGAARYGPVALLAIGLLGVGAIDATYQKPLNTTPVTVRREVAPDISALFATGRIPATSESVTGTPLEPVSLVIIAKDRQSFVDAMRHAGWIRAQKPGLNSLARAGWAALTNQEDATAPVTPYFWEGQPNDYGFQKPTSDRTLRKRHHARFWNTRFVTPTGARIIVGTASFDDGMNWDGLHHIDPNIDAERNRLIADLKQAGDVKAFERFQLSTPRLGQDVAGDPWFTDGKAILVTLK